MADRAAGERVSPPGPAPRDQALMGTGRLAR
jgi:hypothetical protein